MMLRVMKKVPFNGVVVGRRWVSNTVMSFGDGSHGALGLPTSITGIGSHAYEPTPISALPPDVSSIAAGHHHSLAVTSQGHLWSWGRNAESQLGRGLHSPRYAKFSPFFAIGFISLFNRNQTKSNKTNSL